jgi:hypothetical protein
LVPIVFKVSVKDQNIPSKPISMVGGGVELLYRLVSFEVPKFKKGGK